jgi:hypothetical protein
MAFLLHWLVVMSAVPIGRVKKLKCGGSGEALLCQVGKQVKREQQREESWITEHFMSKKADLYLADASLMIRGLLLLCPTPFSQTPLSSRPFDFHK